MNPKTVIKGKIHYVGVNDRNKHLFEGMWPLPYGVSYNSYLIDDETVALVDTVDICYFEVYLRKIKNIIGERPIHAGIISSESDVFPIIQRSGINKAGKAIRYFFNYSSESKEITHNYPTSKELISGKTVKEGDHVTLPPWGILIMEVY